MAGETDTDRRAAGEAPEDRPSVAARRRQVFLDPSGQRARAVNLLLLLLVLAGVAGIVSVATGVLTAPALRPLTASQAGAAGPPAPRALHARMVPGPAIVPLRARTPPESARDALRLAFFSDMDIGALSSLRKHADRLDGLLPDWLELKVQGGSGVVENTARRGAAFDWLKRAAPRLKLYPVLKTDLAGREVARLLAVPATRAQLVAQVAARLEEGGFHGVAIGFTDLSVDQRIMALFIAELGRALKDSGRKVICIAAADAPPPSLAPVARAADYILIATQEHFADHDHAAPIAGQGWFEARTAAHAAALPREKLIFAVGSLAYDWGPAGSKTELSVQTAWEILRRTDSRLALEPASLAWRFSYHDDGGGAHDVWLADAVSAFNHAKAALALRPAGLAVWRLGLEDPGIFGFIGRGGLPDEAARRALEIVEPGYGVFESATGALLSAREGAAGSRQTTYNAGLGLIVAQNMPAPPVQAALVEWPVAEPKGVALTFDDGPDPAATGQILDILAARGAKATFYMVGQQVLAHPDIARRVVREGHDVGNHTFSHPDLNRSSAERVAAELTATQRVFESELGVRSALFRPPFAMMGYDYLEQKPALSETASRLGYLFGGIDIDAFDYFIWTGNQIAERVIRAVRAGEGHVVLMHDAGGDRRATIKALPIIIDTLQAEGFRFVTTQELVGAPADALVSPYRPPTVAVQAAMTARSALVRGWMAFTAWLPVVAIAAALLGTLRLLLIVAAALMQRLRQARRSLPAFTGSVAVVVPAYNEEKVVCNTVRALLASTIADRLVITVVDDGSTDGTSAIVRETFRDDPRVAVHRKENGGKASALNHGIGLSQADVIVAIDGDTWLAPEAIAHLVAPFADPRVAAVAGKVMVGNRVNLLTRFQSLEYIIGQSLERAAFEMANAIGVVPGAVGAWRRAAVAGVGGYSTDTLAEDADLTVTLERAGWRVVNAPDALASTEAPETLRCFMKQRFRWMFGTLQVARKHSGAFVSRPTGVALVTLPNVIFQFGFTLIAPLMDLLTLWIVAGAVLSSVFPVAAADDASLWLLAGYWALFLAVDLFTAGVGLALHGQLKAWRLLPLVVVQRVTYRQLLYVVAIRALLAALKGTLVGWGKLVRTGRALQTAS